MSVIVSFASWNKNVSYRSIYIVLALIISSMGTFIAFNVFADFTGFVTYLGFADGRSGTLLSWLLALVVVISYSASAAKISDVRRYMFKVDILKGVAIVAAVCAGIVEEIVFRKWVMDYLASENFSILLQILASGIAFGLAHLIWGLKNIKAGVNAALSTCLLGFGLGCVYWLGDRSLAPCIVAHFLITALIEPGMLVSAQKDKLGYWTETTDTSLHTTAKTSVD